MHLKTRAGMIFTCLCVLFSAGAAFAALPEFTGLVKEAGPAVVNISTVKVVKRSEQMDRFFHQAPPGRENPFEDFFDQFERFFGGQQNRPRKQRSLGSGFIISKDGFVVTNNHVIEGADEVVVNLKGNKETYDAAIVGRDPETDLALLKIDVDHDLPVLAFGDSDRLDIGQWVVAIGNPFGLDHTVTAGIVSAKGRVIGSGPYDDFIQTDASINPGNSGGPLLNLNGKVVGINSAIVATGQGIGFAIPSNMAERVIAQLKEYKRVKRGWLGVTIQDVDENTAKALGLGEAAGALVASVQPGDPADEAGLRTGDVILEINGHSIEDAGDLTRRIGDFAPKEKVRLTLWRDGKSMKVTATLGERDMTQVADRMQSKPDRSTTTALGLELRPVTEQEAEALGLEAAAGLLVASVSEASKAEESGIRPGDVVIEANSTPVNTVDAFLKVLEGDAKKKGVIMLLIKRRGQNLFRTIPLED